MLLLTCMDKIYIHSYKKNQPELSKVMRYWSLSIASLTIFTTRPNAGILTSGIERPQTPVRNAGWKSKALPCYSLVALMSSLAWNSSAVLPAKQLQPPKKVGTVLRFVLFCLVHFIFAFIFACDYRKICNLFWRGIRLLSFQQSSFNHQKRLAQCCVLSFFVWFILFLLLFLLATIVKYVTFSGVEFVCCPSSKAASTTKKGLHSGAFCPFFVWSILFLLATILKWLTFSG